MSIVTDFKSIARKLNCQEQKAEWDAANPKPEAKKVVWTPEWGYGSPMVPLVEFDWSTALDVWGVKI